MATTYEVSLTERPAGSCERWQVRVTERATGRSVWAQTYRHHRDAVECVEWHALSIADGVLYD